MSNLDVIEKLITKGDLKALTGEERVRYYNSMCQGLGLEPGMRPFDYLELNGKLVLYVNKGGAEQLRKAQNVSIRITSRKQVDDVYIVTALAKTPDGREDESTGAVVTAGLSSKDLANAYMKAETKAKRRVTLSICGLGMLDESELDNVPSARRVHEDIHERITVKAQSLETKQIEQPIQDDSDEILLVAEIGYNNKQTAIDLGFKWDKERKKWTKVVSFQEHLEMSKMGLLNFPYKKEPVETV